MLEWQARKTLPHPLIFMLAPNKIFKQAGISHGYCLHFFPCFSCFCLPYLRVRCPSLRSTSTTTTTPSLNPFSPALPGFTPSRCFRLQRYLLALSPALLSSCCQLNIKRKQHDYTLILTKLIWYSLGISKKDLPTPR